MLPHPPSAPCGSRQPRGVSPQAQLCVGWSPEPWKPGCPTCQPSVSRCRSPPQGLGATVPCPLALCRSSQAGGQPHRALLLCAWHQELPQPWGAPQHPHSAGNASPLLGHWGRTLAVFDYGLWAQVCSGGRVPPGKPRAPDPGRRPWTCPPRAAPPVRGVRLLASKHTRAHHQGEK